MEFDHTICFERKSLGLWQVYKVYKHSELLYCDKDSEQDVSQEWLEPRVYDLGKIHTGEWDTFRCT